VYDLYTIKIKLRILSHFIPYIIQNVKNSHYIHNFSISIVKIAPMTISGIFNQIFM